MRALALTALVVITLSNRPTTSAQSAGLVDLGVTVVNGVTHEPIKGADVRLQLGDDRPTGPQSSFIRVVAGQADTARAEFPAFATGWYSVSAQKTGWGVGSFGQQAPGGLADEVDLTMPGHREIDVPLWPPSSLSGTVTDEDGRPVSGVSVKLLFNLPGIPGWRTSIAQVESSGAGGAYRFNPLPPGRYLVAVTPLAAPTRADVPLNAAFLPRIYPSARVQSEAQVVEVGAGEQRVLDLNVWSHNLDAISGVVRSPSGDGIKTSLKLRPVVGTEAGLDDLAVETISSDSGAFTFPPLPPGDYRIDVTPPIFAPPTTRVQPLASWSTTRVTLTAAGPVRDLEVLLRDGFDLSGRIEAEPTASGKRVAPPHSTVTLMRADAKQLGGWKVAVSESRFTVGPIAPGRYRLGIDVDDPWDVSEVLVGGHDMWGQPAVTLETGSDVTIRMTNGPLAKVLGSVSGIPSDGCRGHNCWVGLFPVDESQWSSYSRRLPFLIRLTSERTFAFGDLLPGDYYAVVSEPQHVERWPSADVLKKLVPFATRVTVKRAETPVDLVYRPH